MGADSPYLIELPAAELLPGDLLPSTPEEREAYPGHPDDRIASIRPCGKCSLSLEVQYFTGGDSIHDYGTIGRTLRSSTKIKVLRGDPDQDSFWAAILGVEVGSLAHANALMVECKRGQYVPRAG